MKNFGKSLIIVILSLLLFGTGCARNLTMSVPVTGGGNQGSPGEAGPPGQHTGISTIFVENSTGIDDGITRLLSSMAGQGLNLHQSPAAPSGLIGPNDVVILKINAQWAERGGTSTDLIRGVIQALLDHPGGFTGEIIVADNGQAQFGSERRGGSLDWANPNSDCLTQSTMDVIRYFRGRGHRVTGSLWDEFTLTRVDEFSAGDNRDGFIVEDLMRSTGFEVSYPKFTTEFGTMVSFKEGIWNPGTRTYDSERLKVINMPVLKSHGLFQVTAAVKNYMGVPSARLTNLRPHNSVGRGGMGTMLVETRMPVLNILDMIWIAPDQGPASPYSRAVNVNKIAASTDPVALDYWAAKYILMPETARRPGGRAPSMDPDGTEPGTFGHWLRLSMNELHNAGIPATMNESQMRIIEGRHQVAVNR
ncbi:MAG: DUF362 domain-containing protein [Treponema sp.]|nr:DUF362 domain-containing protein [Treponema sp.]